MHLHYAITAWVVNISRHTACIAEFNSLIDKTDLFQEKTETRRALGEAHVPPTKVFRRLTGSVNKTMLKPRLAAAPNQWRRQKFLPAGALPRHYNF